MPETSRSDRPHETHEPRLTIEMCGANLIIRSSIALDDADACTLADAVNAAAVTNTVVVIDPPPVRCGDAFAATADPLESQRRFDDYRCEPVDAEAVGSGMIRIPAERSVWTIDLRNGRLRRSAAEHANAGAWTSVIAIMVTPKRLTALTADGMTFSTHRAHRSIDDSSLA